MRRFKEREALYRTCIRGQWCVWDGYESRASGSDMCVCARLRGTRVCGWISSLLFFRLLRASPFGCTPVETIRHLFISRVSLSRVCRRVNTRYINNIVAKIAVKEYWNLHALLQLFEESKNIIISIYRWHSTRVKSLLTILVYVLCSFFCI